MSGKITPLNDDLLVEMSLEELEKKIEFAKSSEPDIPQKNLDIILKDLTKLYGKIPPRWEWDEWDKLLKKKKIKKRQ